MWKMEAWDQRVQVGEIFVPYAPIPMPHVPRPKLAFGGAGDRDWSNQTRTSSGRGPSSSVKY